MGDRMKIHASGEDYSEAVLMLQKEKGRVRSVDGVIYTSQRPVASEKQSRGREMGSSVHRLDGTIPSLFEPDDSRREWTTSTDS